jgi:hypothetical protein
MSRTDILTVFIVNSSMPMTSLEHVIALPIMGNGFIGSPPRTYASMTLVLLIIG